MFKIDLGQRFTNSVINPNLEDLEACLQLNPQLADQIFSFNAVKSAALHIATRKDWLAGVKILSVNMVNIDLTNEDGDSALHIAAQNNFLGTLQELLEHKADIRLEDITGRNVLHLSCENGHFAIMIFLMEFARNLYNGEEFHSYVNSKTLVGVTPLQYAAINNHYNIVDSLLGINNIEIDALSIGKITALHNSARHCNQFHLIKQMVEIGANVNAVTETENFTPLYFAALGNCTKTVTYLVKKANLELASFDNTTALHVSSQYGFDEITKILLQHVANPNTPNSDGIYPIHFAAAGNHPLSINYLLINNANIEAIDADSNTPLLVAAQNAAYEAFEFLINHNANIYYTRNHDGVGIIHAAAIGGNIKIFELISKRDQVLLFAVNKNLGTAMHYAVAHNQVDVISYLQTAGLGIDLRDKWGFTSLHIASLYNMINPTKTLIEKEANCHLKNFLGQNVHNLALDRNNEMTAYLRDNCLSIDSNINDWLRKQYYQVILFLYSPLCKSHSSENPIIQALSSATLGDLGDAVIHSGKGLAKDDCEIYSLKSLQLTHSASIKFKACEDLGLKPITTVNYRFDQDIYICKPDDSSWQFSQELRGSTILISTQVMFKIWEYGYNFVTHSHQRTTAFFDAVKKHLVPSLTLSELLSLYSPKIIEDGITIAKNIIYHENVNQVQLITREISNLQIDHYYLVQLPAKCAINDYAAYNLTYKSNLYNICHSPSYYSVSNIIIWLLETSLFILPVIMTASTYWVANTPVKKAAFIGGFVVASGTAITNFITSLFENPSLSLSEYYVNQFMEDHENNKSLYLVQHPGSCAEGNQLVYQPLSYLGGDWNVCQI